MNPSRLRVGVSENQFSGQQPRLKTANGSSGISVKPGVSASLFPRGVSLIKTALVGLGLLAGGARSFENSPIAPGAGISPAPNWNEGDFGAVPGSEPLQPAFGPLLGELPPETADVEFRPSLSYDAVKTRGQKHAPPGKTGAAKKSSEKSGSKTLNNWPVFRRFIQALRNSGVNKLVAGETHESAGNLELVTRTVEAASADGKSVHLYRELNTGQDNQVEAAMNDPSQRKFMASNMARDIGWGDPMANAESFERVMARKGVKPKLISFNNPSRWDMSRFIEDESFSIASVGVAHALYKVERTNWLTTPWGKNEFIPDAAPGQGVPPLTSGRQNENFGGLSRAQLEDSAVFVGTNQIWLAQPNGRDAFFRHFNEQGMVVMEMHLTPDLNAIFVGEPSELETFQQFAADPANKSAVYLVCDGIPGCTTPSQLAHHDEL